MTAQLSCPICAKKINTIKEINEHLDNVHFDKENDNNTGMEPFIIDRTIKFVNIRKSQVNKATFHRTKLELRLVKLLCGLQKINERDSDSSNFWNWKQVSASRDFEQSVVTWEDESVFERCRFCGQRFSLLSRKHHCRICGLVMCGDVDRECSLEVPAVLLAQKLNSLGTEYPELERIDTEYPVRICTECRSTLYSRRNYLSDVQKDPPRIIRLFKQLEKLQGEVVSLLPEFEELLATAATRAMRTKDIARIRQSRHNILRLFSKYEGLTRKIQTTTAETEAEILLRNQILLKATRFLETTMIPLQSLPQVLSYSEPQIKDKSEATRLQNTLMVLEEQKFLLENQVAAAKRNRQFDVLPPMEASLAEISSEVSRIIGKLGKLAPSA